VTQAFVLRPGMPQVRANAIRLIQGLAADKCWKVTIARHAERRSTRANAYAWSQIYAPLVTALGYTPDEWHRYFCGEFFGWKDIYGIAGRKESRPKRTTTTSETGARDVLSGQVFSDFLEFVQAKAAESGVFVEIR
jgi:hypothetical protein